MANSRGVPDTTVEDKVRFMWAWDNAKHDLGRDIDDEVNKMTNAELLQAISQAIEERLSDHQSKNAFG
jgi:tRNA A37 N6-isopentenylltransferase MiaA